MLGWSTDTSSGNSSMVRVEGEPGRVDVAGDVMGLGLVADVGVEVEGLVDPFLGL